MIMVTGGAGFIGSNFLSRWPSADIIIYDALTYAGDTKNISDDMLRRLRRGNLTDRTNLRRTLHQYRPWAVIHFAAESHVTRSLQDPAVFVITNVVGTFCLLEEVRHYWKSLPADEQAAFRFVHISTDEVYGSLEDDQNNWTESAPMEPNTPYAASKVGAEAMVRAYNRTFGLPTIIVRPSNNYGPRQDSEKLIPTIIKRTLRGQSVELHGDGQQLREWLHVDDCCLGVHQALILGVPGQTYNLGGFLYSNLEVAVAVSAATRELVDQPIPPVPDPPLCFVPDRLGNDRCYRMNCALARTALSWSATTQFNDGIKNTIKWYLLNEWRLA